MFTQNFFTDNATHKQNCTSFNPKRVITHNVYDRKPFLNMSRSVAQITHTKVAGCAIMRVNSALAPRAAHRATRILQLFYHSSISSVRPRYHRLYQMIF
ncbi:hypothetical protein A8H26_19265 [Pluralibacter gergoviae]|nr:hypothetical protein A8H26_19265 [Pluralibacter gergoviae]